MRILSVIALGLLLPMAEGGTGLPGSPVPAGTDRPTS